VSASREEIPTLTRAAGSTRTDHVTDLDEGKQSPKWSSMEADARPRCDRQGAVDNFRHTRRPWMARCPCRTAIRERNRLVSARYPPGKSCRLHEPPA